ncbi:hypothetical protein HUR95_04375 [Caldalkalibacillus thermarum TA2.A1]|uniref:Uncharacterized protein n=1 Tax=Caldalkalibacillus thermarum (strain TA2.A1) TaxID=986075 RepID=A0A8X8IAK2_CALTT|nr:hypothetical protein [Caldalkalibacillus thermarum]QZT34603.1 hypothetical protein HUR95_04375 [Caldalkalibacillus thermarum TA2.A1]
MVGVCHEQYGFGLVSDICLQGILYCVAKYDTLPATKIWKKFVLKLLWAYDILLFAVAAAARDSVKMVML